MALRTQYCFGVFRSRSDGLYIVAVIMTQMLPGCVYQIKMTAFREGHADCFSLSLVCLPLNQSAWVKSQVGLKNYSAGIGLWMAVARGKGRGRDLENCLPHYSGLVLCMHRFSKFKILLTPTALDYLHFLKLQIISVSVDNISSAGRLTIYNIMQKEVIEHFPAKGHIVSVFVLFLQVRRGRLRSYVTSRHKMRCSVRGRILSFV